jgi:CRP-like cAMP-binding protein
MCNGKGQLPSNLGRSLSKGTILFREGDQPTGVYVVLEGSAKISLNSAEGKTLVLGFYGPGTILGLAAAILGRRHEATAEILKPTKVLFVPREDVVREIRGDATAGSWSNFTRLPIFCTPDDATGLPIYRQLSRT